MVSPSRTWRIQTRWLKPAGRSVKPNRILASSWPFVLGTRSSSSARTAARIRASRAESLARSGASAPAGRTVTVSSTGTSATMPFNDLAADADALDFDVDTVPIAAYRAIRRSVYWPGSSGAVATPTSISVLAACGGRYHWPSAVNTLISLAAARVALRPPAMSTVTCRLPALQRGSIMTSKSSPTRGSNGSFSRSTG